MSQNDTTDIADVVDTYLAMWNETDSARRAQLIEQAWAEDCRYVDPMLEAEGHAALGTMVAGLHAQLPDHRFSRTGDIDAHHDQLRFGWQLAAPDGTVAVAGIDVATVAPDGRLRHIVGFFDRVAL